MYSFELAGGSRWRLTVLAPENKYSPGRSKVWQLSAQQALFFPPIDSKVATWCRAWQLRLPLIVSKQFHRSEDST